MKPQTLIIIAFFSMASCQQNQTSDLEAKRQALESKRQELKDKKELATLSEEMKAIDDEIKQVESQRLGGATDIPSANAFGFINGKNVTVRSGNSAQSAKIGTFEHLETVTILYVAGALNANEVVLNEAVNLSTSEGTLQLPKGKAVRLGKFRDVSDAEGVSSFDAFDISFEYPGKGTVSATISASYLDLSENLWYRVKRANGSEGWVLGKFVSQHEPEGCGS